MIKHKNIVYNLIFIAITQISSANAGLWDWLRGKSEQATQEVRTVPSWNEQEEAYKAYYKAPHEDIQKITNPTQQFDRAVDCLAADPLILTVQTPKSFLTIAMLSHLPEIRKSEKFEQLKNIDLVPAIKYCEENKKNGQFPYAANQEAANRCLLSSYKSIWHWDNVRATIEHYYGPKRAITLDEVQKRAKDIRTYYERKQSQVPRTWSEWLCGDSKERKLALSELQESKNRAIHYLANQYEDQQNAQSLAEKTKYDVWQREDIVNTWREFAYVTQKHGVIGELRSPKEGTLEHKAVKAATDNLKKYTHVQKQLFFQNALDGNARVPLLFDVRITDTHKE